MRADLFIGAQAVMYEQAVAELRAGVKQSHWMWFVFPQLVGLGRSHKSRLFGLEPGDAPAYWSHPVLGARLYECAELVLASNDPELMFGADFEKLRSSMTLFHLGACASTAERVLDEVFGMQLCAATASRVVRIF